ncbi:hypothetical protein [Cellulosimicrobium arenosum]|uniref:Lipoprotein n=1 Tax=Cellulosimicrobium arenosum TaxID=2708133 RepID=A0A927G9B8_9MICO|nr:hypothetical protein [Cellulosimicrobium arenosum]MBD8078837.1 hypothetical protein [Cellulosimicrobium arenosum]
MHARLERVARPARRAPVVPVVLLGLVLSGCAGGAQPTADYPWYEDVPALLDEADLVVVGTSVASRPDVALPEGRSDDDPQANPLAGTSADDVAPSDEGVPITVHTVEVTEVLVGAAPAGTVEVAVTRGSAEDGEELGGLGTTMLFLRTSDGPAHVVGGPQGVLVAGPDGGYSCAVDGLPALETTPTEVRRLAVG